MILVLILTALPQVGVIKRPRPRLYGEACEGRALGHSSAIVTLAADLPMVPRYWQTQLEAWALPVLAVIRKDEIRTESRS